MKARTLVRLFTHYSKMLSAGVVFAFSNLVMADTPYNATNFEVAVSAQSEMTQLLTSAESSFGQGNFTKARESWELCLAKSEKKFGPDHINLSSILISLGYCNSVMGNGEKALSLFQRAIAIREKAQGKDHPDVAPCLRALASFYKFKGNYEQALTLYKRSLAILEKAFGPDQPELVDSLVSLAEIYSVLGDSGQAVLLLQRAQDINEKHFGIEDTRGTEVEGHLAVAYVEVDNSLAALELVERKFAAREMLLKPENSAFLRSLDNLASIYALCGAWDKALPLLRRSLSIKESLSMKAPLVDLTGSVAALATCCSKLGKDGEALPLFQRVVLIKETALGKESPAVAESLCDLAEFYATRKNYDEALESRKRSLAITEKFFGQEHPVVADNLIGLADICLAQGDYKDALVLSQRGLNIMEKSVGNEHSALVKFLVNLALIYRAQGNYKQALPLCERALSINAKSFGTNHNNTISSLRLLALLYLEHGDLDQGAKYLAATLKSLRGHFMNTYLGVSDIGGLWQVADETELNFRSESFFLAEMYHSICGKIYASESSESQKSNRSGAEQLSLDKALLEEMKVVEYRLWRTWNMFRSQDVEFELSFLTKTNLSLAQRERRRELQNELKEIKNQWLSGWRSWQASIETLNVTDLSRAIPAGSVLVDFVQFHRYNFPSKTNAAKELRYAAYLTFPMARDSTNVVVERMDMGEAAPINEAVEYVNGLMNRKAHNLNISRLLPGALKHVSDLVYAPLLPYLTNVSHLIICPDGQLSLLPFEMLPVGNKFLIEEKTVSYVTSGREVVRVASPDTIIQRYHSRSLVMGDPDFDFDLGTSRGNEAHNKKDGKAETGNNQSLLTSAATKSLSRDYRGLTFYPLPGSGVEATNVAGLLGADADLRLGADAREAELYAVISPRVLHLATHGFYLPDQEFKGTNGLNNLNFTAERRFTPAGQDWENPLVRCGLAFAGANHALQITNAIAEDGLLTGLEASLLQLQGTKLVILSACDTGAGDVKIGEGVMSLRRAFRIAGAESVLASHWPVNDKATGQLMTDFMRRWHSGEPRAQAWREAQLSLLRSKDFSNPYFWAAFTLTGEWR